jgi:hypothetical protein
MLKTPVIAETLLRQYYAPGSNTNEGTAVKDAFIYLCKHGLLDRSDHVAAVTPKGEFFIKHILAIPFPVEVFIIPGTE